MRIEITESLSELTIRDTVNITSLIGYLSETQPALTMKYLTPIAKEMSFSSLDDFMQTLVPDSDGLLYTWGIIFKWNLDELEDFLRNRYEIY